MCHLSQLKIRFFFFSATSWADSAVLAWTSEWGQWGTEPWQWWWTGMWATFVIGLVQAATIAWSGPSPLRQYGVQATYLTHTCVDSPSPSTWSFSMLPLLPVPSPQWMTSFYLRNLGSFLSFSSYQSPRTECLFPKPNTSLSSKLLPLCRLPIWLLYPCLLFSSHLFSINSQRSKSLWKLF